MKKRKLSKKNIVLMLLAILAAVLCVVMPEQVMAVHKKNIKGVCMDVPEEYYPTSSYYEVIKASSEKLSGYQKSQLITGLWDSEISEVDRSYYEDTDYHMEKTVRGILKKMSDKKLYPVDLTSSYSNWYNWKCTYMQSLDMSFRSYAGFFWKVEFIHYKNEDRLTAYVSPEGRIIELDYVAETDDKKADLGFEQDMDIVQLRRLAGLMLGENSIVSDMKDVTEESENKVKEYLLSDRFGELPDNAYDEDIVLIVKKITVRETDNESGANDYYFYLYNMNDRLVEGFLPVD